jgi:hypothetical protein
LFKGRGCALIFYFILFYTLEGEGRGRAVEVGFFFPSFEMWKEEGKKVIFLLNFFFIVEWLRKGKVFFFLQIHYGGKGWLKVAISKILGIHGFEIISFFLIYSFRMSSAPSI